MNSDFGETYDNIYKDMLEKSLPLKKETKRALFWPVAGGHFKKDQDLLFIGREGRGGFYEVEPSQTKPDNLKQHVDGARDGVKSTLQRNHIEDACPMSWIFHHREGNINGGEYNWRRSAFWRVISRVICNEQGEWDYGKDWNREWWSYCAWSNLYKISPSDGKKPTTSMYKNQKKYCQNLLKIEMKSWSPKAAIIIVGKSYAEEFFEELDSLKGSSFIEAEGECQGIPFVITKRPEAKPEESFADEISKWLKKVKKS